MPSAGRVTVLIKLDQEPGEYAMRIASTSQLQNLQGFAILRYQNVSIAAEFVFVRRDYLVANVKVGTGKAHSKARPSHGASGACIR